MEFKSISELRAEYRDNPEYAVKDVIPDMVAELQADPKYAGYTAEQLELIARAKLNTLNGLVVSGEFASAIPNDGRPTGSKWSQYSYEEILAMEQNGVNIPKEFTDWAHSMQDSDATNYVMDESELNNSSTLEEMDQTTENSQDSLQAKAKAYAKKCEQQEENLNNAVTNLAPKKDKAEQIQRQAKTEQENGMKQLTDMAKRWNELDKKLQNGEELTELEQREYAQLNKSLNGANADLRRQMTDTVNSLDDIVTAMDGISNDIDSNIDLSAQTIELANTLAGVQKGYNPTSIPNKIVPFMVVGELANMIYGAKGQSIARDTVDAGIDLQELSNDTQVEINKNVSLYDFAIEYGTNLNDQLSEVEKLLGENPNKDDRTAVTKSENKAAEKAENNAIAAANGTTENLIPAEPETEVTTGTPDANISNQASENLNPANSVVDNASNAKTAQTAPVVTEAPQAEQNKSSNAASPSKGGDDAEVSLDEQGEGATEDARSTTPKVDSKGVEAETETKEAQKTQKDAKKETKEIAAREKQVNKKSKQVNGDLANNNSQSAALNDEMTSETEAMVASISENPEESQVHAESIAIVGGKIMALGLDSGKKSTEFTEETEEFEKDAEKSQKQNEKAQKNNSKVEKAISVIDQIAAVGLQKGMSTIGTGAVMTLQGQGMIAAGTALLSNPFTAAVGTALVTAGTTTTNIGLGAINVGGILSTASFYTLAATKVTKMTIAACNGDLKGVFKNLGAFATVCATSVASCAATMAVGTATMGVTGPIGTAIASQAVAVPFDVIGAKANRALSNDNLGSDDSNNNSEVVDEAVEKSETQNSNTAGNQSGAVSRSAVVQSASASSSASASAEVGEETSTSEEGQGTELNAAQQARADMLNSGASKRDVAKMMVKKCGELESDLKPAKIVSKLMASQAESTANKANILTDLVVSSSKSTRDKYDELYDKVEADKKDAENDATGNTKVDPADIDKLEFLKDKLMKKGDKAQNSLSDYDAKLYSIQAKMSSFIQPAAEAPVWGEETIVSGYDLLGVAAPGEEGGAGQPQNVSFRGIKGLMAKAAIKKGNSTIKAGEQAADAISDVQNAVSSGLASNNNNKNKIQETTFSEPKGVQAAQGAQTNETQNGENSTQAQGENTTGAASTVSEETMTPEAVQTENAENVQTRTAAAVNNAGTAIPAAAQNAVDDSVETTAVADANGAPAGSFAAFQSRMASASAINGENAADSPEEASKGGKGTDKKEEEVTVDSIDTNDGKSAANENQKEGENVEKENKDKTKASKDAKKEGKDLEKTDKQLQKEIKTTQKEIKEIEEKIVKLTEESQSALDEIDAENEQQAMQAQQSAPAAGVQPTAANASMSAGAPAAGAPTGGAASVLAVPSNMNASAPAAANAASAFDISGGKIQKLTDKVTANVAQITGLQTRSNKSTKKLQKNLKTQQKRAEKAQKASEKEQKQNEKLDKALTYIDYAATATKITGKVFMGVGTAQVTAGNILIATGTPLLSNPFTMAAGTAMVTAGTALDTTGTSNVGVGNVLNVVGTYTGIAVKLTKITIAACQGNLMGVLTNAAALGMSCIGGLPGLDDASKAVDAAAQAGVNAAVNSGAQAAATQIAETTTETLTTNIVTEQVLGIAAGQAITEEMSEQLGMAIMQEVGKEAYKEGFKSALFNTDTLMTLGGAMMGAAGSMMSKSPEGEEKQRRDLHLTDRKRTARVIKAINRRKGQSQYGRQGR